MNPFRFNTAGSIVCEQAAATKLADFCQAAGMSRVLLVTDPGIQAAGLLKSPLDSFTRAGLPFVLFDRIEADPPEQLVLELTALGKEGAVDGVVGFGGGSSLDSAKLAALLLGSGEPLKDIYGVDQAKGKRLPLILVPTTAGTGSEVTAVAIVTTGETTKTGVVAQQLLPDIAILDAQLTLGLPAPITAATGIDAMVHAIEAYSSVHRKNAYSDMLAIKALQLMGANIERATHHGDDLASREAMLFGACLAGQAFANAPVAAVHALAYPLGGHYHIPHGLSNSLVLPHVLKFNAPEAATWYAELADVLVPAAHGSDAEKAEQLVAYFHDLIHRLALPASLAAMDIPEADLPMLAADAMLQQRLLVNNPRPVEEQDALAIYQAAYHG